MTPSRLRNTLLVILSFHLLLAGPAFSQTQPNEAWEKYASAQKKLQVAMHHLLSLRNAELKPILDITRDLQLAEVDERTFKFYFVKTHAPEKIVTNQNLQAFANFPWTEQDTEALKNENSSFKKLGKEIEKLKAKQQSHPDWPKVREKFDNLTQSQDPEYVEIMVRFNKMVEEVQDLLHIEKA